MLCTDFFPLVCNVLLTSFHCVYLFSSAIFRRNWFPTAWPNLSLQKEKRKRWHQSKEWAESASHACTGLLSHCRNEIWSGLPLLFYFSSAVRHCKSGVASKSASINKSRKLYITLKTKTMASKWIKFFGYSYLRFSLKKYTCVLLNIWNLGR